MNSTSQCKLIQQANLVVVCDVSLEILGIYKFSVFAANSEIIGLNEYVLLSQITYVDLTKTLILAMPFNLYEEDQNPLFGMSSHLMPVISQNWITYKVVLRDRFGNALLREYKFLNTVRPFTAFLTNQELDLDINFKWGEF